MRTESQDSKKKTKSLKIRNPPKMPQRDKKFYLQFSWMDAATSIPAVTATTKRSEGTIGNDCNSRTKSKATNNNHNHTYED